MSEFVHKDNSGSLFRNDKGGNDKRPDYRGDLNIGGVLYEIAGWIKEGINGKPKFMSLSVKPKEALAAKPTVWGSERPASKESLDFDDDIAF